MAAMSYTSNAATGNPQARSQEGREQSMILLAIIASTIHVIYYQFRSSDFSNVFFLTSPAFLSFVFLVPVYISSDNYSYSFASYAAYLTIISAVSGALVYLHHRRTGVENLYIELRTKAPIDLRALALIAIGVLVLAICSYFFEENTYNCIKRCKNVPYFFWVEQKFLKQYIMFLCSIFINQLFFFRILAYAFRSVDPPRVTASPPNKNEGA
jgi:hypothetical protein